MVSPKLRRNRSIGPYFVALFIALTVVVSVIGWLFSVDWRVLRPNTRAKIGSVETAFSGTGLALREEEVLYAPVTGKVDQYVSEDLRVPAGKLIAVITNQEAVAALSQEKDALQRRLEDIATRNPFNKTSEPDNDQLDLSAEERMVRERLRELEQELETCEGRLIATTAGEVAFYVDGLESPPPKAAIKNLLTVEQPLDSFPKRPEKPVATVQHRMVEMDKPLAKIVDTLQFWVVVDLPASAQISAGQRVKARFTGIDQDLWEARVDAVVPHPDFVRVVLFFPDYQSFFTPMRWVDLTVVTEYHKGVWVPIKALRQDGDEYRVFVKGLGGIVSKPVRVIGQDAENAIIDGLAEGSRVIL